MGCAASSSSANSSAGDGGDTAARKYSAATGSSDNMNERRGGPMTTAGRRTRADSHNSDGGGGLDGEYFKAAETKPLMRLADRKKVVDLYASTFQSARQVLATIGRIKTTMKRWVQAARQRLQEKKAAQQGFMIAVGSPENVIVVAHVGGGVDGEDPLNNVNNSKAGEDSVGGGGGGGGPTADPDGWTVGTPQTMHGFGNNDDDEGGAADLPLFPVFLQDSQMDDNLLSPATHMTLGDLTPTTTPPFDPTRRTSRFDDQNSAGHQQESEHRVKSSSAGKAAAKAGSVLISQRLKHLGLAQLEDPAADEDDGNCQFRALAHQILGDASRHAEVRKKIIQAMLLKKEDEYSFLFESADDCQEYLDLMAEEGTLGDELTLRAACDVYGIVVHLITSEAEQYYVRYVPNLAVIDPDESFDLLDVFLTVVQPVQFSSVTLGSD